MSPRLSAWGPCGPEGQQAHSGRKFLVGSSFVIRGRVGGGTGPRKWEGKLHPRWRPGGGAGEPGARLRFQGNDTGLGDPSQAEGPSPPDKLSPITLHLTCPPQGGHGGWCSGSAPRAQSRDTILGCNLSSCPLKFH